MIKELLSTEHSKKVTSQIIDMALEDKAALQELMTCFFSDDSRICQRAAWPIGILAERQSKILQPYILKMIAFASKPVHNAIKRNVVRSFQYMEIPEKYKGKVYQFCFDLASRPSEAIAVRCFSLRVCLNIARKHPELLNEIVELVAILEADESPAVRSVLRHAHKIIGK